MWSVDKYMKGICRLLAVALPLLFTACGEGVRPVLGELVVDSVTSDAVHCHVEVLDGVPDGYAFYYATTKSEVEKGNAAWVRGTYDAAVLSAGIEGLRPNTTYYIRAYAINLYGRTYTATIATRTLPRIPMMDDNDYPTIE